MGGTDIFFVPARAKNLAAVGKLIDYLAGDEYPVLSEYGIEGYTFRYDNTGLAINIPKNSSTVGLDSDLLTNGFPCLWNNGSILPRHMRIDRAAEMARIVDVGKSLGYPEGF
ncbi:MAG: hypothetical protein LBO76_07210, partial [Treponema sp.]|nr:hypothetical protein [Treponema sp.]